MKSKPDQIWIHSFGEGPIVATAVHDGHSIRKDLKDKMHLSEKSRLREEDPYTGGWTECVEHRIIGTRSRFEVDLNRPREKAVYLKPEDAWGLHVWKEQPSEQLIKESLAEYDAFYSEVQKILTGMEKEYGRFVVFDLHSYNHLRDGENGPPADPEGNPEVNIGTGTLDRVHWAPVIDRFISSMRAYKYFDRHLDVRENIKFRGGNFPRWINENFPKTGCAIAIEFKKFFMNEWSGEPDHTQVDEIGRVLKSTVPFVLEGLKEMPN